MEFVLFACIKDWEYFGIVNFIYVLTTSQVLSTDCDFWIQWRVVRLNVIEFSETFAASIFRAEQFIPGFLFGLLSLKMEAVCPPIRQWSGILDKKQTNSVAWARERTIQTERPPLLGEVFANFCG
jgi:hypothetical protein